MHFKVESLAELYSQIRQPLLDAPIVAPRGLITKEILGVSIELTNPRSRLAYHKDRHFSLPFAIAESVLFFHSTNSVEPIAYINPRMMQFSDDGKTLYGSYGKRVSHYINRIVEKLKFDEFSRQAILIIPRLDDIPVNTKDWPCTCLIQFMLRNKKLHCFVSMRSNDSIWGLPYDLFVYTSLQETLANELGVEVGTYYHNANSFHIYQRHFKLLEQLVEMQPVEFAHDYVAQDIVYLSTLANRLKYMNEDDFSYYDTNKPYEWILEDFHRKKAGLAPKPLPEHLNWIRQFIDAESQK
jgi:thymidylate synthase